ncbi:hypothetical protein C0J52_03877 [Blattella germanica]|nr:hypothetical protein C0J52_03877 [Blattella germanica]
MGPQNAVATRFTEESVVDADEDWKCVDHNNHGCSGRSCSYCFHRIRSLRSSSSQITCVYFTKYCRDMCAQLGIGGRVKNSKTGTIVGKMQGERNKIEQM